MTGARLFADRECLIAGLDLPDAPVVAEVGVARGDFSQVLLQQLNPALFVAIDLFELHHESSVWGIDIGEFLEGMTHLDYYRERFAHRSTQVAVEVGPSHQCLARYDDATFDLIYIDAGHDYDSVRRDAEVSMSKIKPGGILVFNDYTMYDHLTGSPYGIVPVVNQILVHRGWRVTGFALQRDMFCDIAIRQASNGTEGLGSIGDPV